MKSEHNLVHVIKAQKVLFLVKKKDIFSYSMKMNVFAFALSYQNRRSN